MEQEILKNVEAFNKNAIAATKDLVSLNGKLFEKVLEKQLGVANLVVEGGEKQLSLASSYKDPQDFFAKQSALVEEYAGKFAEAAQDNVKLAQETGEDYKAWFENGLQVADKAAKAATKTATKAVKVKAAA